MRSASPRNCAPFTRRDPDRFHGREARLHQQLHAALVAVAGHHAAVAGRVAAGEQRAAGGANARSNCISAAAASSSPPRPWRRCALRSWFCKYRARASGDIASSRRGCVMRRRIEQLEYRQRRGDRHLPFDQLGDEPLDLRRAHLHARQLDVRRRGVGHSSGFFPE